MYEQFPSSPESIGECSPSIAVVFLARLKREERRIAETVNEIRRGQYRDTRRRKWRNLEDRISSLKNQYVNGAINLEAYWNAIRYAVNSR